MNQVTNTATAPLLVSFATQESRHRRNTGIMVQGLRAVEMYKPDGLRPLLKAMVSDELWPEPTQAAALKALAAYKNPEDVATFLELTRRDDLKTLAKWTAVASLAEYSPDPKARETLSTLAVSGDFEVRARALWALGAFPGEDVRALLLSASRDNNNRIRLFAVKGLAKFTDDGVNELLVFKKKNDPEKSIREAAGDILKARGMTNY
jgi:HEAT repeat protein